MTAGEASVPVLTETGWDKLKYKIYGLIFIGLIVAFIGLCAAQYGRAFESTDRVYLDAGRSGLQMYPGNRVQMRGVDVGRVATVSRNDEGGVRLALDMDPYRMADIPGNPVVALGQLTAFGAKTVQMTDPARAEGTLQAGAQIATGHVTVEVNDLLGRLQTVLDTADPAKVNSILGGLSSALNGRGEQIGDTVGVLNEYLRRFNPNLPQLQRDFQKGGEVLDAYADIAPDLLATLDSLRAPSRTVVAKQGQLADLLGQLTKLGNTGQGFFARNGSALEAAAANLRPTTSLLKKYSPEFSCFFQGAAESSRRLRNVQGNTVPGLVSNTVVEYAPEPYQYPEQRPVVGADNGPDCNGLPFIEGDGKIPKGLLKDIDKGGHPSPSTTIETSEQPLVATLFGPKATLPLAPAPQAGGNQNSIPGGDR